MKCKWIYLILAVCFPTLLLGQDSLGLQWTKVGTYPVDSNAIWSVDQLNNVYVSQGGSIIKYDSTGVQKFQQSVKSYGKMKQLVAINSMKLVHFSEEQQTLCFFDNTLTATEDCIDLTDYDIYNASLIAASARPDFLWVYDNINSTIKLISFQKKIEQQLEIVNIKGLLGISEVDQILEESGRLYLLEGGKKLYELDFYGGLLQTYSAENWKEVDLDRHMGHTIYAMGSDKFEFYSVEASLTGHTAILDLPIKNIIEFEVVGNYVYFRTPKNVHKYTLHFKG